MRFLKRWKEVCFLFPAILLVVGVFVGFQKNTLKFPEIPAVQTAEKSAEAKDRSLLREQADEGGNQKEAKKTDLKKQIRYKGKTNWKDGTYIGSGTGFGGSIKVQVAIKKGKIVEIKILSHAQETPEYFSRARVLTDKILKAQSPNVDVVAGATFSSRGILEAVTRALVEAGDETLQTTTTVAETTDSKNTVVTTAAKKKKKASVKGQPADGVFSGSAVCERFGYTIHLKARFKKGKAVALYELKVTGNSNPENVLYWKRAWKPIVKNILKKQSGNVDAVSGATYSSNAIMDAYLNAYEKAVAKNDSSSRNTKKPVKTPAPVKTQKPALDDREETPKGEITDGTYHVSAVCSPDSYKDFKEYMLSADVVFQQKKCTAITNFTLNAEANRTYYLKAAEGTKKAAGVVEQILKNQSTNGIYAVTGATCSSKTIRVLYRKALAEATGTEAEESKEDVPTATPVPTEDVAVLPVETAAPTVADAVFRDGTYPVTTTVYPDDDEDFYAYELRADAVVSDGRFAGFENITVSDQTNLWYCNRALEGTGNRAGILKQLLDKQNALGMDMVTGATCSSSAWIDLFKEFSKSAKIEG